MVILCRLGWVGLGWERLETKCRFQFVHGSEGESFDFDFVFFPGLEIAVRVACKEFVDNRIYCVEAAHKGNNGGLFAIGDVGCFKNRVEHFFRLVLWASIMLACSQNRFFELRSLGIF